MKRAALLLLPLLALSACGTWGRLKDVGRAPGLSETQAPPAPTAEPSLTQLSTAQRGGDAAADPQAAPSASLFRTGAGALFQDQRASKVGDILTLRIDIADKANVSNATSRSRTGSEEGGASAFFGLEKILKRAAGIDSNTLVGSATTSSNDGKGTTSRSETISLTMAAIVSAVLPNGNLVIKGRQETRVNFELRELLVTGIVRPQDVARDNSIRHTQIAEARISYGGKGQLTDAQQARWGQQLLNVLSPF